MLRLDCNDLCWNLVFGVATVVYLLSYGETWQLLPELSNLQCCRVERTGCVCSTVRLLCFCHIKLYRCSWTSTSCVGVWYSHLASLRPLTCCDAVLATMSSSLHLGPLHNCCALCLTDWLPYLLAQPVVRIKQTISACQAICNCSCCHRAE